MKYALHLSDNSRVLSVTYSKYSTSNSVPVDVLPEGNISDYLYINGEYIYDPLVSADTILANAKTAKKNQISNECSAAIVAGVDAETTQGMEHFSLEETDQINLSTAITAIQQGATEYPYHADGKLCRVFSAKEIMAIVQAGTQHKLYHTTLCNHIFSMIEQATTVEEVKNITYSADILPKDLTTNMQSILASIAST